MDKKTLAKIKQWQEFKELDPDLKKELDSISNDEAALMDAFYNDIAFGTGGLRGVLGVGTDRMNIYVVRKCTLGFLNYMIKRYPNIKNMGVAISYDCRKNSYLFAKHAAEVIASNGVKAYLYTSIRSTPQLSFTVRNLKCAGGIMITASHNPPKYNGYKIYDHEGCQLVPDLADLVIEEIEKIRDMFHIETMSFDELVASGMIQMIDELVDKPYLEALKTIPVQPVKKNNIKIVYTPLHGTGASHMVELLTGEGYTVYPVEEQMVPDGNFSTLKSPNPEEPSAFEYAIRLGKKVDADILVATDPDADRMGIAAKDSKGEYVLLTGNQTGAILLDYLGKFKKPKTHGVVFNTIVTSNFAKAICEKYNLKLVQTLTGFKYIGEQAALLENSTDEEFFFGYEESYGYVIKDFVRDKDAVSACSLLAEICAWAKDQGKTLYDVLMDIYVEYGFSKETTVNVVKPGKSGADEIKAMMDNFRANPPKEIGSSPVKLIKDYKTLKMIDAQGNAVDLDMPETSNVLQYFTEDGTKISVRPSGTEPKIKFYIEVKGEMGCPKCYASADAEAEEKVVAVRKSLGI